MIDLFHFIQKPCQIQKQYSAIEKEVQAVVEALRKCRHYLISRQFKPIIDHPSVSFMFYVKHKTDQER